MKCLFRKFDRILLVLTVLIVAACSSEDVATVENIQPAEQRPVMQPQQQSAMTLDVYKSPTCGCCDEWVSHVEEGGFRASDHHPEDLNQLKIDKGIAPNYQSCHTAVTADGYVFEGHVPVKFIHQFLANPPANALGLAVPGMPLGSPGMEVEDRFTSYEILLLKDDGSVEVFAKINTAQDQYD